MICEFERSFVRWRSDTTLRPMLTTSHPPSTTLNNVRIPLDCVATFSRDGRLEGEFSLSASCKTERVFVERDIWTSPNADMCAIVGGGKFLVVKRWDCADKRVMLHPPSLGVQPERHCVDPAEAFIAHSVDLLRRPGRQLSDIEDILGALTGDARVVARTTFLWDGFTVAIEYPVKTVNFSERHRYYQVDTGPVLFPSRATGPHLIECLHLAYVAHLGEDWAEFLISLPTPVDDSPIAVHHYSDSRRVVAENSLWVFAS